MGIFCGYAGKGTAGTGKDTYFSIRRCTRTHIRHTRTHNGGFTGVYLRTCEFYLFVFTILPSTNTTDRQLEPQRQHMNNTTTRRWVPDTTGRPEEAQGLETGVS